MVEECWQIIIIIMVLLINIRIIIVIISGVIRDETVGVSKKTALIKHIPIANLQTVQTNRSCQSRVSSAGATAAHAGRLCTLCPLPRNPVSMEAVAALPAHRVCISL